MRELVRKLVTFGIIGGGCALLFFVINYVCLRLLEIPFLIALALTYLIGGFGEWLLVGLVIGLVYKPAARLVKRGAGV